MARPPLFLFQNWTPSSTERSSFCRRIQPLSEDFVGHGTVVWGALPSSIRQTEKTTERTLVDIVYPEQLFSRRFMQLGRVFQRYDGQ